MRGRPGCLLQSAGGEANRILLASVLSSMRIICPNKVSRRDWIIAVSLGCFVSLRTSSFRTNWYHLMPISIRRHHWSTASILQKPINIAKADIRRECLSQWPVNRVKARKEKSTSADTSIWLKGGISAYRAWLLLFQSLTPNTKFHKFTKNFTSKILKICSTVLCALAHKTFVPSIVRIRQNCRQSSDLKIVWWQTDSHKPPIVYAPLASQQRS